jgi:inosine-uridine nucleoside N-ribohydrolase
MPRKIIIDTDPGIDDALAIYYALAAPELELVGLTTIFGNCETPLSTTNALRLLEIAGRGDIPVAEGAHAPLVVPFGGAADFVHGADGQGDINLPAPTTSKHPLPAAQFIVEMVNRSPEPITLVPIGPLTNIALALALDPTLERKLGGIVLMGGNAFAPGNISPAAEANILGDPEAAERVFRTHVPIVMIGLDLTDRALMTGEQIDRLATFGNPRADHLARIIPFYRKFHQQWYEADGILIHDSMTIAYLLHPHLFKTRDYQIVVELQGVNRGRTTPAFERGVNREAWKGRPNVTVCLDADIPALIDLELQHHARP